jgi:outer membrane protein assembly factor BamA
LPIFRFILLTLMGLVSICSAAGVDIRFTDGSEYWRARVIRLVADSRPERLEDTLATFLINNGFLDCRVSSSGDSAKAVLSVEFGRLYHVGNFIVKNDFSADTIICNCPFDKEKVESTINELTASYQARGFYFVTVMPSDFVRRNSYVDISLDLQSGPTVTISAVEINGLVRTDEQLIKRYLQIDVGDTVRPEEIIASAGRLRVLDFVSIRDDPAIIPDGDYKSVRVLYNLIENKRFFFEGTGGYVSDAPGSLVWFLHFSGRNLFGAGQRAGLLIDKREKTKSILEITYGQPLLWAGTSDMELGLKTRDYRDQFYEFSVGLFYRMYSGGGFTFGSSLGWKNVEPADVASPAFQTYEVGIELGMGRFDDLRDFGTGSALSWGIQYSGRRYKYDAEDGVPVKSSYNDVRNKIRAASAIPLFDHISEYLHMLFNDVESAEKLLPPSEMFLFGGPMTLRGYRNDQFAAQRLVIISSEIRAYISASDYFYPFIDGAYYEYYSADMYSQISKFDDIIWGYGFGTRFLAGNRQLRIELSWNPELTLPEPRLNVTFINRF